jgi:hypothetical protein
VEVDWEALDKSVDEGMGCVWMVGT